MVKLHLQEDTHGVLHLTAVDEVLIPGAQTRGSPFFQKQVNAALFIGFANLSAAWCLVTRRLVTRPLMSLCR